MPESPKNLSPQQSHAQILRDDALRRLSRSPHPYHRQRFELLHASERVISYAPAKRSPLTSKHNTDDEEQERTPVTSDSYRESTTSDSGTEADDEHFLKGLPAPKIRPHKGLRGLDGTFSASPSPLPSPAILNGDAHKPLEFSRTLPGATSQASQEEAYQKAVDKIRHKRRVEVIRRVAETGILGFVAGLICLNPNIRQLIWSWKREFACESLIILTLVAVYPLRLLRHTNPSQPWKTPLPLAIPTAFDPAPILYPPIITILVSLLVSTSNPTGFLSSLVLAVSSLPKQLIPSTGGFGGGELCHWFLSCLPILISSSENEARLISTKQPGHMQFNGEKLVLLQPLHLALCETLHYLTTTSLLPAELQLLSISLIELLLLASSPQAVILKSVLWGCGIGILVTCTQVLQWGVSLARVPKWRFRRVRISTKLRKTSLFRSLFGGNKSSFTPCYSSSGSGEDSGDDEPELPIRRPSGTPKLELAIDTTPTHKSGEENGSVSANDDKPTATFVNGRTTPEISLTGIQRRHTLPATSHLPRKSSKRTPSGRRKRSASSSVQSFSALTQAQATIRKWVYAGWVYVCIGTIILVGVREYISTFALRSNEPIGWALGYLFGDIPRFRMEIVKANLQRWVCLPARSGAEEQDSCHMGWVEHIRHASFGESNTRLVICAYWLSVIIVGLAVVFRLSAIYEVDTRRKVFHFMMVAMLLPATYVDPAFAALALALMLAIFLLLDLFRASQLPPLSKSLAYFLTPYVDGRDLKGPVVISHIFLLIGCAIPLWLSLGTLPRSGKGYLAGWEVPTREVSMVSGVICVGLGDAAASLIGRRYGRRKWIWGGGKSIEGSVAFAAAVGTALSLAKLWLRIGGWPTNNDDCWITTFGKASIAAGVASLTEAVLTGGNDNVVVPVVLWLCVKGLDI
ncbi:cytidylyltransferase [Amylocarpus encephaloides]|uniref:dolichol kinase n=1 Tax=Amylocarpus encephaloides TaxID=45428 RepID=A0A9P8C6B0_9HELO|nr:cytidylyltransferase [Amylocarpus encephaloides]